MSEHRIEVVTFIGRGATDRASIEDATRQLQDWYEQERAAGEALYTQDGDSVFRFGTAALASPEMFVFIITVFDTRQRGWLV